MMGDVVPDRLPKPWTCSTLPGCDAKTRGPGEQRGDVESYGEILLNEKVVPEISGLDANEAWMGVSFGLSAEIQPRSILLWIEQLGQSLIDPKDDKHPKRGHQILANFCLG